VTYPASTGRAQPEHDGTDSLGRQEIAGRRRGSSSLENRKPAPLETRCDAGRGCAALRARKPRIWKNPYHHIEINVLERLARALQVEEKE